MRMAQSRAAEFVHRSADAIIYTTLIRVFCVIICLNSIEMRGIAQTMPVDQTSLVRNVMDLSADPCVDINQYACGNFSRLYPIPSDKSSYSLDDAVNSHVPHLATVRTIEEQAEAGGDGRPADVRQIGDFYASCMDTKTINSRGGTALDPVFKDILSVSDRKTLPVLLAKLQLLRVSSFFSVKTTQDLTTGKLVIPKIDEAKLGLPSRQAYVANDIGQLSLRSRYLAHITKMLELSGESNQASSSDAQAIFALESALARATLSAENQRDPRESNHELSVQQLSTLTPHFDWLSYFHALHMPNSQSVDIVDPEALRTFDLLISQTDLSTIRTYLRWSLLSSTPSTVLPSSFEEEDFAFNGRFLHGQPEQQPRSLSCTILVEGALEDSLAKLYVERVMSAEDRHRATEIVQNIEAAMDRDIEDLTWMSFQTKIEAKRKLHLIVNNVGFPPVWRDYSKVAVRRDDALGNVLRGLRYREKLSFSAVGKPIDRTRGVLGPLVSGASYSPEQNEVEIPAAEIQPPNFVPDASDAENYARLGFVVGHEVTHAFDDEGRHYDGLGALRNWWTSNDSMNFGDRAACFVKKYGALSSSGGQHINGILTLGENLADNGGLRLAYMAFLADAHEKGIDLERVQRGYTPRQEFFLSFAQYWCETIRPEQELRQIQGNPHTPDRFRGIEVLKNLPDFGDAFGCKAGKPMTPEDHCRVW